MVFCAFHRRFVHRQEHRQPQVFGEVDSSARKLSWSSLLDPAPRDAVSRQLAAQRIAAAIAIALAAAAVGPIFFIYLWSCLVLSQAPINWLAPSGFVLALLFGLWLVRSIRISKVGFKVKIGFLMLVGVARVLPIHMGIAFGLYPVFANRIS